MRHVVCFHNPNDINAYLSNWYMSDFVFDGIKFTSLEQYMMYQKAVCFNDSESAKEILSTDDVGKIKALGRQVKNYNNTVWNGMRQVIVYNGLLEKFRQNEELKKKLLATKADILVECSVSDMIWGNGISMHDERRFNMKEWRGQNLLGFTLMQVRETLKREEN